MMKDHHLSSAAEVTALRARLRPLLEGPPTREDDEARGCLPPEDCLPRDLWAAREALAAVQREVREGGGALAGERLEVLRRHVRTLLCHQRGLPLPSLPADATGPVRRARRQLEAVGDGWSWHPIDEGALFGGVPGIWLRPGYRLCGYVYVDGGNGNGVVWAVPERAEVPQLKELRQSLFDPPRPMEARSPAEVLEGDGSLGSYLQASVLLRELGEFGARWHGVSWGCHEVVDSPPEREWCWREGAGAALVGPPAIEREGEVVTVAFCTFSALGEEQLLRCEDRYGGGRYQPSTRWQTLATGSSGYVV